MSLLPGCQSGRSLLSTQLCKIILQSCCKGWRYKSIRFRDDVAVGVECVYQTGLAEEGSFASKFGNGLSEGLIIIGTGYLGLKKGRHA